MTYRIAVLPGDGIGPETIEETLRVLDACRQRFGFGIETSEHPFGGAAIDACGDPFPPDTLAACREADAVLKGAIGGPRWDQGAVRPEMGLLRIRAELGVFANVRPVRLYSRRLQSPLRPELVAGLDLIIVRELTGGLYFGPKELDADHGLDTCAYTRPEVERVARRAFELARSRRGLLCSVDKMNVLSSSKLWRAVVVEVAADYRDVELSHQLVDSMAMKLIEQPAAYDVILTENMFGDILSDLAASVGGGVGLAPSSSLGSGRPGLYEAVHGSAPDIAGQGKANPAATMLSAAMMLRDLGEVAAADAIEATILRLLDEGPVTPDLGGSATTRQFGDAVCDAILASEVIST
jgi:3-isopropylmalate dehydrogenase